MAFDWVGTNEQVPERGKVRESEWLHSSQGLVTWTRPKLEAFKQVYEDAGSTFEFEGKEFLKSYAKYLIQYLDDVLA